MSFRSVQKYTVINGQTTTGAGLTILCRDYKNAVVKIGTSGSANLTVKCQGSIGEVAPSFGSAQSVSNHWDYLQMIDLQDGSSVNGDTGFVVSGTDDFRLFEININSIDFVTFNVTARSAGSVTVEISLTDNQ